MPKTYINVGTAIFMAPKRAGSLRSTIGFHLNPVFARAGICTIACTATPSVVPTPKIIMASIWSLWYKTAYAPNEAMTTMLLIAGAIAGRK